MIPHSPDAVDVADFWSEVRAMGTAGAQAALAADVEVVAGSMSDGLDPAENWVDDI